MRSFFSTITTSLFILLKKKIPKAYLKKNSIFFEKMNNNINFYNDRQKFEEKFLRRHTPKEISTKKLKSAFKRVFSTYYDKKDWTIHNADKKDIQDLICISRDIGWVI